ncbi:hypothetical protein T492DRAFT_893509 [Pavlovales sp. CCMP2436]|nr:hypothetical protein T492DRAFT_893509 [Pavlovales sp. CCMP2436]
MSGAPGSSDERPCDGTGGSPPPGERGRSVPRRGELCSNGASDERSGDAAGNLSSDGASDERRGDAAGEATRDSAGRCGEGSASVGGYDEGAPRAAAAGPFLPRPKNANIALRSLCAALCQLSVELPFELPVELLGVEPHVEPRNELRVASLEPLRLADALVELRVLSVWVVVSLMALLASIVLYMAMREVHLAMVNARESAADFKAAAIATPPMPVTPPPSVVVMPEYAFSTSLSGNDLDADLRHKRRERVVPTPSRPEAPDVKSVPARQKRRKNVQFADIDCNEPATDLAEIVIQAGV